MLSLEPRALIAEARRNFGKLLRYCRLVVPVDEMQRSCRPKRKVGLLENLKPIRAAPQCELMHRAVSLSDWPDQTKIPHRCARRARVPLKHDDAPAPARRGIGVSEPENSCSNNRDV